MYVAVFAHCRRPPGFAEAKRIIGFMVSGSFWLTALLKFHIHVIVDWLHFCLRKISVSSVVLLRFSAHLPRTENCKSGSGLSLSITMSSVFYDQLNCDLELKIFSSLKICKMRLVILCQTGYFCSCFFISYLLAPLFIWMHWNVISLYSTLSFF